MSDAISIRQAAATTEIAERIQRTQAVSDQSQREGFAQELQRQGKLKQSKVNEGEKSTKLDADKDKDGGKGSEKHSAKSQQEGEQQEAVEPDTEHLIDLQV